MLVPVRFARDRRGLAIAFCFAFVAVLLTLLASWQTMLNPYRGGVPIVTTLLAPGVRVALRALRHVDVGAEVLVGAAATVNGALWFVVTFVVTRVIRLARDRAIT